MATYRARWTRLLLKHYLGRRYKKAGRSIPELRKLDDLLIQSQRPPRGTHTSPVVEEGFSAEWIQGPDVGSHRVILHLHGGAFVTGSPATHRELAAMVSVAADARVLSPAYRLAPEHPFPAALEDTLSAYRWLLDQGFQPSHIILGGESSGGGLALQALLSMKSRSIPLPRASFFLSPVTDWASLDGDSYGTRASLDPLLTRSQCQFTASLYVGGSSPDTPLLRPTEMSMEGLPPMWIQVGDHEVLLSDSERLALQAQRAGVSVDFKVWPGLWHVFQAAARFVPEARSSLEELGRFVRREFSQGQEMEPSPSPPEE